VVFLLLRGEDEILVAVFALQSFVGEWHAWIHPGNVRTASRYSLLKTIRIGTAVRRKHYPLLPVKHAPDLRYEYKAQKTPSFLRVYN
jgi:hypothetical protein